MADQENIPVTPAPLDDDTRTRKTMRLRTLIPAATGPQLASPEQSAAEAPAPAGSGSGYDRKIRLWRTEVPSRAAEQG